MGIRIEVGSGGEKPKAPVDRSTDASRKIEIKGGKGLDLSSPSSSVSPSLPREEKCNTCNGPFRDKDGTYGSKRIEDEGRTTTLTCKSCTKDIRAKSGSKSKSERDAKPPVIKPKDK